MKKTHMNHFTVWNMKIKIGPDVLFTVAGIILGSKKSFSFCKLQDTDLIITEWFWDNCRSINGRCVTTARKCLWTSLFLLNVITLPARLIELLHFPAVKRKKGSLCVSIARNSASPEAVLLTPLKGENSVIYKDSEGALSTRNEPSFSLTRQVSARFPFCPVQKECRQEKAMPAPHNTLHIPELSAHC